MAISFDFGTQRAASRSRFLYKFMNCLGATRTVHTGKLEERTPGLSDFIDAGISGWLARCAPIHRKLPGRGLARQRSQIDTGVLMRFYRHDDADCIRENSKKIRSESVRLRLESEHVRRATKDILEHCRIALVACREDIESQGWARCRIREISESERSAATAKAQKQTLDDQEISAA